jgi:LPXTG-site transpeptidase (sortase) family protein
LTTPIPPAPALSINASANTVSFNYEDYDSTVDIASVIDLLFTVTVTSDPFADGLFLTNQAHVVEGTTNANPTTQDDIVQIRINEPALYTTKAAVSTNNPNGIFTPLISAPISFNPPGTGGVSWSGGVIHSDYLAAHPIDSNLGFVDAGDLVRFAIVVQNQGHSGGFDIRIRDTLQPGYVIPGGPGLNLQIYRGDGAVLTHTDLGGGIFGSGIQITDDPAAGACQAHNATTGRNVIIITYDLQLDNSITLDQGIINTATLFHYAGTPSGPDFTASDLTDTATVQPVTAPVKSIVSTSEVHTGDAGTGTTSDPRLAAIGEIVRFRVVQSIPEGTVTNFRLHDALPPGLTFLNDNTARMVFVSNDSIAPVEVITSTTLGPDPALNAVGNERSLSSITPGFALPDTAISETDSADTANYAANNSDTYASGDDIFFKFGTVSNHDRDSDNEYVIIEFNAIIANVAGITRGIDLDNQAAPRYGTSLTDDAFSPIVRTRVVEPTITYGKTIVSLPSPLDAGGVVQYRLSFANANGTNDSDAFDIHLTDALPAQLQLDLASINVTLAGGAAGVTNGSVANNIDVTIGSVPKGGSVTVDYSARILDTVTIGEIIANASTSTWTSLPGTNGTSPNATGSVTPGGSGSATGERNGTSGGVNDYFRTRNTSFSIALPPVLIKQITAASAVHTLDSNVTIGEVVTYGILLTFPEGTTPSDTVLDDLPAGLEIVDGSTSWVTIAADSGGLLTENFSAVAGYSLVGTTNLATNSATFTFGNVLLPGDNNVNNNTILLRFQARVSNVAANITGRTLLNQATHQVGTAPPVASNVVTATVVQPSITFAKEIVSLSTPLDAGGVVHYRITYANETGANVSTAMDVNITDTLAAALRLPSISAPDIVITASANVGAITNGATASTSKIDILIASVPPGESVIIDFYPVIQSSITPGQVIDNVGHAAWTSLEGSVPGERTGIDGPIGSPDNYAAVRNVSFTIPRSQTVVKQLTATSAPHTAGSDVTIGEEITYDILLTFPEGMTPSDTVVDDLPVGLEVVGTPEVITTAAASGGALAADFNGTMDAPTITVTGTHDSVTFGFSNVSLPGDNNAANNTILLRLQARVLNVNANQNAVTLDNFATNQVGGGAPTISNAVAATIVEPALHLTKQVTDPNPAVGEILSFTLLVSHANTNPAAFDVVLSDDVPAELAILDGSFTAESTGTVTNLQANRSSNHLEITANSMEGDATIRVTYQATVVGAYNSFFRNNAVVTWTSLPAAVAGERDGTGAHNDYSSTASAAIRVDRALAKNLIASNVTSTNPDHIVTIGEILTYQVVLTIPAGSTDTAIITDTLSAGLAFVDCAATAPVGATHRHDILAGLDITSSNFTFAADAHGHNVASCNPGTTAANNPLISNSGSTVRWDLGRIRNAGAAAETVTLIYRVIVLDVDTNVQNVTLDNHVDWTWVSGTLSAQAAPSLRIIEPDLQIEKTVDPEAAAFGSVVTYSIEIRHTLDSLTTAYDVLLTDNIPTGLILDETSITVTGTLPAAVIMTSPTQLSVYWSEFPLGATATVTFEAEFVGPSPVLNTANVEWSSLQIDPAPRLQPQSVYNRFSTERRYDPLDQTVNDYTVASTVEIRVPRLPQTGFAPDKVTVLPEQPTDFSYTALGSLWLEIPRLGIKVDIVGVPFKGEDWNLTWLGSQAGFLAGTAYPTHAGNSGITAHAYLADGSPGPFVDLSKLRYGDQIIIHVSGQRYLYEVRENKLVHPSDLAVLRHEKYPWLTLLTCKSYSEATGSYQFRVAVRAVLVKVENE